MRRIRIYQARDLRAGEELELDARAAHHLTTVLRRSRGDRVQVFDGRGHEAWAEIVVAQRRGACRVRVDEVQTVSRESPLAIELVQALSRPEKLELVLQKAVELGVTAFRPVAMQHCEPHRIGRIETRMQRWHEIVINATEQCGRSRLMTLHDPVGLDELACEAGCRWRLEPGAPAAESAPPPADGRLALAIGPEGGFGPHDHQRLDALGFAAVGLGSRVLRTETAALAAVSVAQCLYGDFG